MGVSACVGKASYGWPPRMRSYHYHTHTRMMHLHWITNIYHINIIWRIYLNTYNDPLNIYSISIVCGASNYEFIIRYTSNLSFSITNAPYATRCQHQRATCLIANRKRQYIKVLTFTNMQDLYTCMCVWFNYTLHILVAISLQYLFSVHIPPFRYPYMN